MISKFVAALRVVALSRTVRPRRSCPPVCRSREGGPRQDLEMSPSVLDPKPPPSTPPWPPDEFSDKRIGRGGHGLPKVSTGPAIPYLSMPCGRSAPETALWPIQGRPADREGGLWPSFTPLDTPRHTAMPPTPDEFPSRFRLC
jgi:hypothetical protein